MIHVQPAILEGAGIRLEPLREEHREALAAAAADGRLWEAVVTSRCRRRTAREATWPTR